MDENPKRQLAVLAVTAVLVAAYYGYTTYVAAPPDEAESPASASPTADETETPASAPADTSGPEDSILAPAGLAGTPIAARGNDADVRQARQEQQTLFSITTDQMVARFSDLHTGLVSLELTEERFLDDGRAHELVTTNKERFAPFRLYVDGVAIPKDAKWVGEQIDEQAIRFRYSDPSGMEVTRRISGGRSPYQLSSTVRVANNGSTERYARVRYFTHQYVSSEEESGGFIGRPSPSMASGVCHFGEDELERATAEDLLDPRGFGPRVSFSGIHDTYFANLLIDPERQGARCIVGSMKRGCVGDECHGTLLQAELRYEPVTIAPGADFTQQTAAYVGPNEREAMMAAGPGVEEVIDLGWFGFIANGLNDLLGVIHSTVGNWGLAIILLTLLVKLLFYPLTMRSFRAMGKMRKLKPQIDEINEKYADERELKGQQMMALYRREKVNPASGCLPSLLQMPVWFALYRALSTNIELYHAPFAIWGDLSAPDPYYILPGLVALLMHFQQRLTPTTMDAAQAKMMMYLMPIMIGSFMLFLPAGLCVYMVTNSLLTMLQQRVIYAKLDQESAPTELEASSDDEGAPSDSDDDSAAPDDVVALSASRESSRRRTARSKNRKKRQRRGRA